MNYRPTYNQVHDVADVTDASDVITEPVTVQEMKDFLRLEGFENDNDSGEFDFTSEDLLIAELITSAREGLEKYCGVSIVNHTWRALITNLAGDIELPFSNDGEIVEITDCNGTEIEDYEVRGIGFLFLESPYQTKMTVEYTAGYTTVPKRLKQAIMRDVAYHYENRNDEPGKIAEQAMVLAISFKRVSTWLS